MPGSASRPIRPGENLAFVRSVPAILAAPVPIARTKSSGECARTVESLRRQEAGQAKDGARLNGNRRVCLNSEPEASRHVHPPRAQCSSPNPIRPMQSARCNPPDAIRHVHRPNSVRSVSCGGDKAIVRRIVNPRNRLRHIFRIKLDTIHSLCSSYLHT